jgi:hypothetical protein
MIRRHLYTEVRITSLASIAQRIAVFSLPVIVLAVLLHRYGVLEYEVAYITLVAGLGIALLGMAVALAAFVVIWNEGLRGLGGALMAFVIGVAVLAWPVYEFARGVNLPGIVDVTTDTSDPPRFIAVASARPSGANPVVHPGEQTAVVQLRAYPGVRPYDLEAGPDEVFNAALALVESRGWRVLDSVSPRGGERDGRIEAVTQTFVMGFREDVSIRIRTLSADRVRIDMRSASRYGSYDFGSNARRVESFLTDFIEARRKR